MKRMPECDKPHIELFSEFQRARPAANLSNHGNRSHNNQPCNEGIFQHFSAGFIVHKAAAHS